MKHGSTMIVLAAALGMAVPMHVKAANSKSDLSTNCQAKASGTYPALAPDMAAVNNLRQSYYTLCMTRRGIMNPELGR